MEKKLCVALTLVLACYWVESVPNRLEDLKFDRLNTDLDSYDIEEEDLDDFSKLLDDKNIRDSTDQSDISKGKNTSAIQKKYAVNGGYKTNHNIEDLKKIFKYGGLHDEEAYDGDAAYALSKGIAGKAVSVTGNEDRKYKKGTKTRGFHHIRHKDEYKKDKEFYEDDETNGVIKKTGVKGRGFTVAAGVGKSKFNFHRDHDKGLSGKQGYFDQGNAEKQYSGYADSKGFDAYFDSV